MFLRFSLRSVSWVKNPFIEELDINVPKPNHTIPVESQGPEAGQHHHQHDKRHQRREQSHTGTKSSKIPIADSNAGTVYNKPFMKTPNTEGTGE